jgi:hypothetical protein
LELEILMSLDATTDAPDLAPPSAQDTQQRAKRRRRDSRRSHGKARLLTLDRLDKRCASAQRALALVREFSASLGGAEHLSVGAKQLIQRCAVLGTFIEACEVKWLQGQPIELLDYLAACNTQRRIIQDLGAAARQARDITVLDPLEYARRYDERRKSENNSPSTF